MGLGEQKKRKVAFVGDGLDGHESRERIIGKMLNPGPTQIKSRQQVNEQWGLDFSKKALMDPGERSSRGLYASALTKNGETWAGEEVGKGNFPLGWARCRWLDDTDREGKPHSWVKHARVRACNGPGGRSPKGGREGVWGKGFLSFPARGAAAGPLK